MTHLYTPDELKERRQQLLEQVGIPEGELYDLAASYGLRPAERALFREIEACDYLLQAENLPSAA